ncbi:MAG: enoyl-CoA hydratase-related protein [Chloroflexota bacterium]|nr:enoyl-CoA hydratase/isomerase family protein [Chloroflexia bacterium]MDQ3227193.1 enoyl-CoA hydratase-related protein [Chloroflexota bacterium]
MAVDVEIGDGIAVITMNRPQALNAFDSEQIDLLQAAFRAIGHDSSVRAVILTGAGDRAFAAGADIKEMAGLTPAAGLAFGRKGQALTGAVELLPQPVIAAVNGYAFGGGCELAIACDIRIAAENARFAQPEVGLGIPPGWGGTQRLPRLIGPGYAAEMIYTGRHMHADEALRIGLINAVHPLDRLMESARELALQIVRNSPAAVRAAKRLISLAVTDNQGAGLAAEAAGFGAAFATPDRGEGMRAFVEKRAATFVNES